MNIGGVNPSVYSEGYAAAKAAHRASAERFSNTAPAGNSSGTGNLVLHCFDTEDGDTAIGAWGDAVSGRSITVYQTPDFDPSNPVYKVKVWDNEGNIVEERMVDISKVDPHSCDAIDMWAYSSHLSSTGQFPDAQKEFLMANAYHKDSIPGYSEENLFDTVDWTQVLRDAMETQYALGNLKGYLDYKKFLDFLER